MKTRLLPLILLLLLPLSAPCLEPVTFPESTLSIDAGSKPLDFTVEVATTADQMHYGLMNRRSLPPMHGMIFVFGKPMKVSFWMKDTPLPLDMLFIDTTGVITRVVQNAKPESTDQIPSGGQVRAVVELMGGSAAKYHIAKGDKVHSPVFP